MSLLGLPLNRTNFEMHIIKPSPFFAGVFETIDGKLLDFEASLLCIFACLRMSEISMSKAPYIETKDGFVEKRKVRVLFEELHYNSDYKPFRVLCISQPFQAPPCERNMSKMSLICG